ncbi:MAG: MFS transporter, partial [Verrucomicrobia bacterium]|nr:MFS transporter [Verrucomicrobiota bacterium]
MLIKKQYKSWGQRLFEQRGEEIEKKLTLFRPSPFFYLNMTQFLSNVNDNIYKYLFVFSFIDQEGASRAPFILSLIGIIYILPYVFFSFAAGTLADRFSKRNIILITKIVELFTISLLSLSFYFNNLYIRYFGFILLSIEEAIMDPSKFSIIPELVKKEQITKANSYLVAFSYNGIMLGTFLAALLTQIASRNYLHASFFCLFIGILGLFTAWKIPITKAQKSLSKIHLFFLGDIVRTLKNAASTPYLLPVIWSSTVFLFMAAFSQGNIFSYAIHSLRLSDLAGGYIAFVTTVGISLGGFIVGRVSHHTLVLGITPFAML